MKALHNINWQSRTVWTGIFSIGLGIAGLVFPEINLSQAPDIMISVGFGLVFLKS